MVAATAAIGNSALLRLAGCPISLWLAAANEKLFADIRRLDRLNEEYLLLGKCLSEHIGFILIPHTLLSQKERALAINQRRLLHGGQQVCVSACRQLAELAQAHMPYQGQLVKDLERAARLAEEIAQLQSELQQVSEREEVRLAQLGFGLAADTPSMRALLRHHNPDFYVNIEKNTQPEGCSGRKSLRRNGNYLWKIIDRAATKNTPRDWHSHVALLPLDDSDALSSVVAMEKVTTMWCENIHSQRQALFDRPLTDNSEIYLSVNPLYWETGEHFQFWVQDINTPTLMNEIEVRRTPLLEIILAQLADGARSVRDFETKVLPKIVEEDHALLRMFADHLIKLGVLQVSSAPRSELKTWHRPPGLSSEQSSAKNQQAPGDGTYQDTVRSGADSAPVGNLKSDGFLDVYRSATPLAMSSCLRIQEQFKQVRRLFALIEVDQSPMGLGVSQLIAGDSSVPLLELLRQHKLERKVSARHQRQTSHWPQAKSQDSAYSRLLQFIERSAGESAVIELSKEFLDDLGAPEGELDWPVDGVFRIPQADAEFDAVLDEVFPAGALDARFVTAMQSIHGVVPHAESYERFLRLIEKQAGVTFVELLIPPLSAGAANAVRRPVYTKAYTGDAGILTYLPSPAPKAQYIPLNAISLRNIDGKLSAEANGRPICPIYHATRHPFAPWNVLADLLLSTGPSPMRWSPRRLHHSLDAFPARSFMPRISVGGGLVVAPAQWRFTEDLMWDGNSSLLSKLTALARIREQLGLPRWVFISDKTGRKPFACDLESLRAVQKLEKAISNANGEILIVEMLPAPDQLFVSDRLNASNEPVASEVMVRLPCDESPASMASRLAAMFS